MVDLAAGQTHTRALLADGSVQCWSYNNHGQLGDGTTDDSPSLTPVVWP